MCLYIKRFSRAKRAKEDIVCFKFISRVYLNTIDGVINYKYYTPYQETNVKLGETYKSKLKVYNRFSSSMTVVNEGLHSFATVEAAKECSWGDCIIVKCYIPKGAKYYIGEYRKYIDYEGVISYASNKIRYSEEFFETK